MDVVELVMSEMLADMESHLANIRADDIDTVNRAYNTFRKYDKDISKCAAMLSRIHTVQEHSKTVFRNMILRKRSPMTTFSKPKDTTSAKPDDSVDIIEVLNIIESIQTPPSQAKPPALQSVQTKQTKCKPRIRHVNITNDSRYKQLPACKVPVIEISESELHMCQQAPIYRIRETNEYVFRINCMTFRGNIGRILGKHDSKQKVHPCVRKNCTGKFYDKECKFTHPHDARNFMDYSWKYTRRKCGLDLYNTRTVGGLDTLSSDLCGVDLRELDLRRHQLMHDLLVYSIIDNYIGK